MASKKNKIKSLRKNQRSYLNKDFDAFRAELVQYGQTYFSDKISDFTENGLAGLFVEMAAYIGDNMSFYLDHQFNELDIITAIESQNIERLVRNAGVKIQGASPATVTVNFYLEAPAVLVNNEYVPQSISLPIIRAGTILSANTGVKFELADDLNFGKTNTVGDLIATYTTMKKDSLGNPISFALKMTGFCTSGITISEKFTIPDAFVQFRTVTMSNSNISEIISVIDSDGNEYYEVDSLTQDTVFKRISNLGYDSDLVSENIEMIPAPYRFIKTVSRRTGSTTLRFGGGSAEGTDDDALPDPSEFAIPLFGKRKTISRFTLDPNQLLQTRTLGIAPRNTTITIRYRAGGGLSHNVAAGSIKSVSVLTTKFNSQTSSSTISSVRSSVEVNNESAASGGEAAMTLNELKSTALAFRNSQSRIVTKEDLVARIYTMPANFGRVFRVGIRDNPSNPLASVVSIVSRDSSGKLIISPDSLKENLRTYLNQYRLISDAIDIVDTMVLNVQITYSVVIDSISNKTLTIKKINNSLKNYMVIENFQIDQPIITSDLVNIILNEQGVISLVSFNVSNASGVVNERLYSSENFSIAANTDRGIIIPTAGAIFELKYPNDDIIGTAR
ncbi:MAG: hypothetical protein CMB80_01530 [Flammeovirgaceae bacterium]|nr:hypothetical protein [Flammeovirgaceae bacterium]